MGSQTFNINNREAAVKSIMESLKELPSWEDDQYYLHCAFAKDEEDNFTGEVEIKDNFRTADETFTEACTFDGYPEDMDVSQIEDSSEFQDTFKEICENLFEQVVEYMN